MTDAAPLLEASGVVKRFGGFTALDGVDLTVRRGEIVGLIGPNGSGKTTLINVISGLLPADAGTIRLAGVSLAGLAPHRRCAAGVNRTFQVPKPFASLSVRENLEVAALDGVDIDAVLASVELDAHARRRVGDLNSVSQKLLDLARALVTRPSLLLVDELACGLNPVELDRVAGRLRALAAEGIGLVVVEHLMSFIDSITDRVVVMNAGREIFGGRLRDAVRDAAVVEVFLGAPEPAAA
ncbi:ABC transporter ATP-binding protein [Methylobacterium platani]|uniref:ABC transporter ATP-binding protein n=2 Tax=Methylobacterium platani TaxID=427683 RepID=A0A179SE33_9HYPH|nr:ATP-binding cassette domain-containing protein [Methylobacterium platani]KMO16296.1 amino acid ABC transporter ATP-binding protein [Methylobacterium platani JCM 14648]OAS24739.1 ABC transporter ATP-binding protein [Methylobacterium platani]